MFAKSHLKVIEHEDEAAGSPDAYELRVHGNGRGKSRTDLSTGRVSPKLITQTGVVSEITAIRRDARRQCQQHDCPLKVVNIPHMHTHTRTTPASSIFRDMELRVMIWWRRDKFVMIFSRRFTSSGDSSRWFPAANRTCSRTAASANVVGIGSADGVIPFAAAVSALLTTCGVRTAAGATEACTSVCLS